MDTYRNNAVQQRGNHFLSCKEKWLATVNMDVLNFSLSLKILCHDFQAQNLSYYNPHVAGCDVAVFWLIST
jgi:hypothetical protein